MQRKKMTFEAATLIAGLLLAFYVTGAAATAPIEHPCHPGPPGPGSPPCPPTATPDPASESESSVSPAGLAGFRVINRTDQPATLWLGNPAVYVFNLAGGSEAYYTVVRSVYEYTLSSCGAETGGYMNLTVHSFFVVPACPSDVLVSVQVVNAAAWDLEVMMSGPANYVFVVAAGQSRALTVTRGDYAVEYFGCVSGGRSVSFEARAQRLLTLPCQ
jgi:hypothetical protein